MENTSNILRALIEAIEQNFGHLEATGFVLLRDEAVIEPTLVEVQMVARNVALIFTVDIPDAVVDLYVAKVVSGRASQWGGSDYFDRITSYLRKKGSSSKSSISGTPRPEPLLDRIRHAVAIYAAMIGNAPALTSDTETFQSM